MNRHIEASAELRATLDQAGGVLAADPGRVLTEYSTPEDSEARCFHSVLEVGPASGGVHHSVEIYIGDFATDGSFRVPLRWAAYGHRHLLPSFDGELTLSGAAPGSRLALTGTYTVPLGPLGRFGDGLAGRRLAQQSIAGFVEGIASRLDGEVDRRTQPVASPPGPHPASLREVCTDNYIG